MPPVKSASERPAHSRINPPVKVSQGQSRLTEPRPLPSPDLSGSGSAIKDQNCWGSRPFLLIFISSHFQKRTEGYGNPRKGTETNLIRGNSSNSCQLRTETPPKTLRPFYGYLRSFTLFYASNFSHHCRFACRSTKWQRRPAALRPRSLSVSICVYPWFNSESQRLHHANYNSLSKSYAAP
jgi:hypothetical protein